MKVQNTKSKIFKVVLYIVMTAMALIMLVPFVWMLSASFKLDKDVFIFPIQWINHNHQSLSAFLNRVWPLAFFTRPVTSGFARTTAFR